MNSFDQIKTQTSTLNQSRADLKSVYDLNFREINTVMKFEDDSRSEALFDFWKKSWEKSFSDLGCENKKNFPSDGFYGKRILSFFQIDKPVGCIFLESFDLFKSSHIESSYLQNFPKEMIKELVNKGFRKAYALTNLTIDSDWRKSKTNLQISQILTSIGVWKVSLEKGDVVLGCTRNDRKVNNILKNHNSKTHSTDIRYNCSVDFTYIDLKDAVIFPDRNISDACSYLTAERHLSLAD